MTSLEANVNAVIVAFTYMNPNIDVWQTLVVYSELIKRILLLIFFLFLFLFLYVFTRLLEGSNKPASWQPNWMQA